MKKNAANPHFLFYFLCNYCIIIPMTAALSHSIEDLQNEIEILRQENRYLKEQIEWFKRQFFGRKSEKVIDKDQLSLLDLIGYEHPQQEIPAQEETVAGHTRRKPNRNGKDALSIPENLPMETTVLDLPDEKKVCAETGLPLVKIGEEISKRLAHRPGSYYIKQIIRSKYVHPQKEELGIQIAELPDEFLPKCKADVSLLAEIITNKFADHLPLYRIAEAMGRHEISISHKLLSQWVVRCGLTLKLLYDVMLSQVLASNNIYIDESPVKIQAPQQCDTGYMWVIVGGKEVNPPYRVYQFREDRSHDHALAILKNYHGVLHSDKYGAYQRLAEQKLVIWCPCWSHVRRKFFEAESGDPALRKWVLRKIRYLFMLEKVAWARSPEERLRIRQEKEAPIIDELTGKIQERLHKGSVLPKSKFREALGYFCGLVPYLKNYTQHPFARLDNNVAERAIRPLTIGRKNWLFFGSLEGGEAGAILLSLVQTCRGLGINPREYLEDVMRRFMGHSANKLHELLPDRWQMARQQS